ncbi:hypothetical protein LEP1GSC074_0559 [Leptospira noguchii str. Hook]|nr:hypothetical protein LEP1GSC074_0559 [Leptospira noguchii str. Hook]
MRHSENTENWYGSLDNRIFTVLQRDLNGFSFGSYYFLRYRIWHKNMRKNFLKE